jgi:hypothetical protein
MRGEEIGVFTHGAAHLLNPKDGPADPAWPEVVAHLTAHYGESPANWEDDIVYYRLDPHWMIVYASDPEKAAPEA